MIKFEEEVRKLAKFYKNVYIHKPSKKQKITAALVMAKLNRKND